MEILTLVLSSLIALLSPVTGVVDRVAAANVRKQFAAVEQLDIRVDAAPNYQLVQGKADRIRLAARGIFPIQDLRLDLLELETDPMNVNARRLLQRGKLRLQSPFRAGIRLAVTEADINRALRSPSVLARLRQFVQQIAGGQDLLSSYKIITAQVDMLDHQRLQIQLTLQQPDETHLHLRLETGVSVVNGRQLRLIDPIAQVNNEPIAQTLVNLLSGLVTQRLDLQNLAQSGITARVLQFQATADRLELAAFVQVHPSSP